MRLVNTYSHTVNYVSTSLNTHCLRFDITDWFVSVFFFSVRNLSHILFVICPVRNLSNNVSRTTCLPLLLQLPGAGILAAQPNCVVPVVYESIHIGRKEHVTCKHQMTVTLSSYEKSKYMHQHNSAHHCLDACTCVQNERRHREKERESVCVCVCVRERERERERER